LTLVILAAGAAWAVDVIRDLFFHAGRLSPPGTDVFRLAAFALSVLALGVAAPVLYARLRRGWASANAARDYVRSILDVAGVILVALDREGRVTLINREGCRVLAAAEVDIVGRDWFQYFLPDDSREEVRKIFEALLAGDGRDYEYVLEQVVTRTGEVRKVYWHNAVLRDETGAVTGTLSSGTDLTEQTQAENALRASEERYRSMFATAPDLILSLDAGGVIIDCNPRSREVLGYEPNELVGRHVFDVLCLEYREIAHAVLRAVFAGGPPTVHEYKAVRADGAVVDLRVNSSLLLDAAGQPYRTISIIEDVTAPRRDQERLSFLAALTENVADAILSTDLDYRIRTWNAAATRTFGLAADEVIGRNMAEVVPLVFPGRSREAVIADFKRDGHWDGEILFSRRDGTTFYAWTTIALVYGADGAAEGIVAINRDITDRKRAEAALRESEERARTIADTAFAGVVWVEAGEIIYSNARFQELFGFDPGEVAGLPLAAVFPPEGRHEVETWAAAGTEYHGEHWGIKKDGAPLWLEVRARPVPHQGRSVHVVFLLDRTADKDKENELRENEEKYRRLFEGSGDGVIVHEIGLDGTPGRFLEVNDAACRMYGRTREELLSLTPVDVRDNEAAVNQFDAGAVLGRDRSAVFERRVMAADGRVADVEINAHVIEFHGRPAVLAIGRDITARKEAEAARDRAEELLRGVNEALEEKVRQRTAELTEAVARLDCENHEREQAEQALRAKERFLGNVFASISDGLSVLDRNLTIMRVNATMERWYEHARPLIGKKCYEAYHSRQEPCEICPTLRTLRSGRADHDVVAMRGPGGVVKGWIDLNSSPLVDGETGDMTGVIEYVRDISAQREAEQKLAEHRWVLENVLNNMSEYVYVLDPVTYEILFVNRATNTAFGGELVGRKCYEAIWSLAAPCRDCGLGRLGNGAGASFVREAFSEKTGRWLNAGVRNVPWLDGRTVCCAVATDTSDQKALEAEIIGHNASLNRTVRERTAALEAKNRELEAFAYSVSHDLRAPLRSMEGFSQALLEDYGDQLDAEARRYLERIAHSAIRMDRLINDLLGYSRLGRNGVKLGPVDMNEVVAVCLEDLGEKIRATSARVEVEGRLPVVDADRSLVGVVAQNLITNALIYHREGVAPDVRISCREVDGVAVFAVADNGLGLEMKYAEKAFNMFQRFHAGEQYPGTGIGLASAKKVIQAHEGRIWFESAMGEGTTFYFTLAPGRPASGAAAADR